MFNVKEAPWKIIPVYLLLSTVLVGCTPCPTARR